tara:strand:- start:74 stop:766 length:693 start_codon:yes stop_codon:yes gene_type:complete
METEIICVSRDREKPFPTLKIWPEVTICVPEDQEGQYEDFHKGRIIKAPAGASMAKLMNRVLDEKENAFLVHDDIRSLKRCYASKDGQETKVSDTETINEIIQATANSAMQAECKIWGFAATTSSKSFDAFNPIKYSGYIPPHAIGVIKGQRELRFKSEPVHGHWFCAMNAHLNRSAWIDTRFCFERPTNYQKKVSEQKWEMLFQSFGIENWKKNKTPRSAEKYEMNVSI